MFCGCPGNGVFLNDPCNYSLFVQWNAIFIWFLYHKSELSTQILIFEYFFTQKYLFNVSNVHVQYVFDVANAKIYFQSDYSQRLREKCSSSTSISIKFSIFVRKVPFKVPNVHIYCRELLYWIIKDTIRVKGKKIPIFLLNANFWPESTL